MTIAIASGKGGTGKTTIATNLACTLSEEGHSVSYFDCDVEEPNGHIFLKPEWDKKYDVMKHIPIVDESLCIHCGQCAEICEANAIIDMKSKVLTFPDLCNACGGCALVCPVQAISETATVIGSIHIGKSNAVKCYHGELKISEPSAHQVIHSVKSNLNDQGINIIDAPPGTSCSVIEAVKNTDFVLLVTEPTPFGLNDLELAVDLLDELKMNYAVLINREDIGNLEVSKYCDRKRIPVLMRIPDNRMIAEAYSRGELAIRVDISLKKQFIQLFHDIQNRISS